MLRRFIFNAALAVIIVTLSDAAILHQSFAVPQITNHSTLGTDNSYNYEIKFFDVPIDESQFSIVSISTAVTLSDSPKGAKIPNTQWSVQGYDCLIYLFNQPEASMPLPNEVVMDMLYNGLVENQLQVHFTEAILKIQWEAEILGWLYWKDPARSDWQRFNDIVDGTTNLASETDNTAFENVTMSPPPNTGPKNDLHLQTVSSFTSTIDFVPAKIYTMVLDTILVLFKDPALNPARIWQHSNMNVGLQVAVGPPAGVPRRVMPFLSTIYAIRTLGSLAIFYAETPGFRESTTRTYYDDVFIATTNLTELEWDSIKG